MSVTSVLMPEVCGIACCSSAGSSNLYFFLSLATFTFSLRRHFDLDFGGIVELKDVEEQKLGIRTSGKLTLSLRTWTVKMFTLFEV